MSTKNRVIWREGLFIKPQHFQQQQRHQDYMTVSILNNFFSHFWGFSTLKLSDDLYALGRIGIKEASGVMPDGTIFSIPNQDLLPQPIDITNITDSDSSIIYLAFPLMNENVSEISTEHNGSRYFLATAKAPKIFVIYILKMVISVLFMLHSSHQYSNKVNMV